MSRQLTEEAMSYFDECVSISTFDASDFSSPEDQIPSSVDDNLTRDDGRPHPGNTLRDPIGHPEVWPFNDLMIDFHSCILTYPASSLHFFPDLDVKGGISAIPLHVSIQVWGFANCPEPEKSLENGHPHWKIGSRLLSETL